MKIFQLQLRTFKKLLVLAASGLLVMAISLLQSNILKVKADVQVLLVSDSAIPFGTVFPGQLIKRSYAVQLDTSANSASYATILEPIVGVGNLCPHLTLTNIDSPTEPDTLALATLSRPGDVVDNWQVALDVPGMAGQIAQDHKGGIVVTSGDYACKITVTTALDLGGCNVLDCGGGNGQVADLALTKLVDKATSTVNSNVNFSLTVNNKGPDTAAGVVLTDVLPANLTFVSATSTQGSFDSVSNKWNVGNIANGSSATLNILATIVTGPSAVNTASVLSLSVDPDLSNNTASASVSVTNGSSPCGQNCGGGPVGCVGSCGNSGGGTPTVTPTPAAGGGGGGGGGGFPPFSLTNTPTPSPVPTGQVAGDFTGQPSGNNQPQVLGAATELPRTGLPVFVVLAFAFIACVLGFKIRPGKNI